MKKKTMLEAISGMRKMLVERMIRQRSAEDVIESEWQSQRCCTLALKLRVLKYQILRDTYTKENTAALSVIRLILLSSFSSSFSFPLYCLVAERESQKGKNRGEGGRRPRRKEKTRETDRCVSKRWE